MNEQQQFYFSSVINLLALALGIENLQENRAQSAYNDVRSANDEQAEYLLGEIKSLFEEQNRILEKQNEMLEKLLKAMEIQMQDDS